MIGQSYIEPTYDAARILTEIMMSGFSEGWHGSIEAKEAVEEKLEPFGVVYTDDMLGRFELKKPARPISNEVKRVIQEGELCEPVSIKDMLEQAGRLLDKSYAHDICGSVLFEGEDGKFYAGMVEFVIEEASPDYVAQVMEDMHDE
jgi:hypothetical protein